MDVSFPTKPKTLISSSIPLSSSIYSSNFHLPSPLRRQFLGCSIRISASPRRCRRSGSHVRSSPSFIRASIYGRSLLVAVAVAAANFAAIRLFYLNYSRRKQNDSKLPSPIDRDVIEDLAFSEQGGVVTRNIKIENRIEDPGNLYREITMEEREHIFEDANNGHVLNIKENMLRSHSDAFECEGNIISKLSQETVKEVLSNLDTNRFSQTEDILPAVMINEVDALELESSAGDMPDLFLRGGQKETEMRPEAPDGRAEHSLNETSTKITQDGVLNDVLVESEHPVSSFNGLSKYVREDIFSFYEEKQSELRAISPLKCAATSSPHTPLQEKNNISPLLRSRYKTLKEAEESPKNLSHATEYIKEPVSVARYKDLSASKRRDFVKAKGSSRGRLEHHIADGDISRSHQPNEIHAKDKRDVSEYLSTYGHLLGAGRLTDCIELLQSLERKGLLDMDKVYHARFLNACKSKKAVKEAFSFTKLIKKPTLSTFNMLLSVCANSQDSEGPFEVLHLVKEAGLKADCKLYTTLISTCAKTGKVDTMFEVFHEMVNAGVEPNVHTYGALIDGCARAGQVAKAFGAYGIMRSKEVKPDRVIFNALITACGQSGAVDRAFDVLAEMRAEVQPIDPDHVTVGALIKTCAQAGQVDRAREVYKMIHQYNIKGTPEVYTIAVNSCSQAGDLEFALSVYGDMKRNGVVPDEMFFSALVDVAGHAGKVDVAFEILQNAKNRGIQLGNISYSSLMGACSKAKNWQKALELYEDLKVIKLLPTVSTLNALITSLCDGGLPHKSVDILAEMKQAGIYPNDVTYSILLVACEKNDEIELGFELFSQAKKDGIVPNLIMCKCLTGLCLQRFEKAASIGEPVLSFSSGRPQIDNKWTSWALMVYRETIAAGIVPSLEVFSQVLGCLRLPCDTYLRNRLVENLGISTDSSRRFNLNSLLDGFGEYDPRSFSLLEEAASLGIIQCVSFKESPIIVDARKLQIHTAEVYLLTILKGLKHRLAAGAKLPSITILLPVEKTQLTSHKGDKTVTLAGRVGQAVGAMLRRLGLRYQGKESLGKVRISGLMLRRWFQPKLTKLNPHFGGKPAEFGSSPAHLHKEITNQQRNIRNSNLSLE